VKKVKKSENFVKKDRRRKGRRTKREVRSTKVEQM